MNILRLGQGLAKCLPMSEGCASTVKLSKQGIEALAKKNPELGNILSGVTEGAANPTLEIMHKAQGNYAVAGFRIKSGETILGKGAYSTSTGTNGVVEKMHFEKGDVITTISKEGNAEPIISEASKTELAKAAQERAKASEYMTTETLGKNGERILKRKLHNGDKVEMSVYPDGRIVTKVEFLNGNSWSRIKERSSYIKLEDDSVLRKMFPNVPAGRFERLERHIRYLQNGKEYKELPVGRIYSNHFIIKDGKLCTKRSKLLEYKGRGVYCENTEPLLSGYIVREYDGRTPKEVKLKLEKGYPPEIEGQEKLNGWNKLANVYPRDLRSILP